MRNIPSYSTQAIGQRADRRFFWNYYLSSSLLSSNLFEFVTPLMSGYVFSQPTSYQVSVIYLSSQLFLSFVFMDD